MSQSAPVTALKVMRLCLLTNDFLAASGFTIFARALGFCGGGLRGGDRSILAGDCLPALAGDGVRRPALAGEGVRRPTLPGEGVRLTLTCEVWRGGFRFAH